MNRLIKIYIALVLAALGFLAFVAGFGAHNFGLFKGGFLDNAMLGARSAYAQLNATDDPYSDGRWVILRRTERGVIEHIPERTWPGYTLYASGEGTVARLIDMDGQEVWRWQLKFSEAWATVEHLKHVASDSLMQWRKALLYPNGDLLALYEGGTVTPSGHGLVRINKNSELIWKYSEPVHHDVKIGEDGNIYTLIYGFRDQMVEGFANIEPPMLVDSIVVLDQDGNEIDRIDVLDAILASRWRALLGGVTPNKKGDYFHTNSIQPLSAEVAAAFDFAKPGQILVSLRELSTVVLIDPREKRAVWAMRGPWLGQHSAELLANGQLLIFDNKGNLYGRYGKSRVIEENPYTYEKTWEYIGVAGSRFNSVIRGAQQRLPNGNTLVTESQSARLFEVTPDKVVVWDFINPVRGGDNERLAPVVMWGQRYSADELNFFSPNKQMGSE